MSTRASTRRTTRSGSRPRRAHSAWPRPPGHVNHADHVALIRDGVRDAPTGRWLELGAGEGAFTLALADVLGPDGSILALDRDPQSLARLRERTAEQFPATDLETVVADFTSG